MSTEHEALFFQGNRCMADGDLARAETCFREALRINPDFAEAHANLGMLLDQRGDADEAESCYRRSLALDDSHAETHMNLGILLMNRKRFDEAEQAYRHAIVLKQKWPVAWSNLGMLYACMKREDEAEQCYRTALAADPDHRMAHFNLSYLLLRQGKLAEGWRHFEARNWYAALEGRLDCPRWRGESLRGKSLLIGFEAGHGDMIQFSRYANILKSKGATYITLLCHPALKTLFATLRGVDQIVSLDEALPARTWDFWTPPLSIPHHYGTQLDSIPADLPYLHAQPEKIAHWAARLPAHGLRVGLAWKGNPRFENDDERSLASLTMLAALGEVAGVTFVSLQKGAGEEEASQPTAGLPLINAGPDIGDFSDTAAIIANLDLVISVDTAIAHLAGALGKPCWVLLPYYKTDWRWLTGRNDSPWYPEVMRLFRQTTMGDWTATIAELCSALEIFVRERRAATP